MFQFSYFKSAERGTYNEIYEIMAANPDVLTKSNNAGIERVKESKGGKSKIMQQFYFTQILTPPGYAFFMESSSIEYIMERDCGLTKVGGELDSKSYGIGMRKNYPYKEQINNAILKLQENGFMHKLKTKWWKQKGAKNCKVRKLESTASKLNSNFFRL